MTLPQPFRDRYARSNAKSPKSVILREPEATRRIFAPQAQYAAGGRKILRLPSVAQDDRFVCASNDRCYSRIVTQRAGQ